MVFHIFNGESTAQVFVGTGIPGEQMSWREDLMTGGISGEESLESWLRFRANALAVAFGLNPQSCLADLTSQNARLHESLSADEVMLWFEQDFFCQINLVYLLNWYQRHVVKIPKLSLPPFVPQLEKGLGTLEAEDLENLFRNRQEVSTDILKLGADVWRAYASPDPVILADFLSADTTALPFLHRSLRCHLSRFPSIENGLGRVENLALRLIASGKSGFGQLFSDFWNGPGAAFGYGDTHFFLAIKGLINCREPLVATDLATSSSPGDNSFINGVFELTHAGQEVLAAKADQVKLNGIDLWLGGAHLTEKQHWRWDDHDSRLVEVRS